MNSRYDNNPTIAVIGLGYVGLPITIAMSEHYKVIGYDKNNDKIEKYSTGHDLTGDLGDERLAQANVFFTSREQDIEEATFYIIAVPTPIRDGKVPDLRYVKAASEIVGKYLKTGDIVVYESTVYPGVTEEICVPILENQSGHRLGVDFKVGYSPERINPGDKVHRLENIIKIVSGSDEEALEKIANVYEAIIEAGVYRAPSIRVAEAAKVIENAQRDVNIAFMNELAMIFSQMNLDTSEVLAAASTKWNFLDFRPGLVGGHCIGIDPYYLTFKAEDEGYHSKIILNSRHVNEGMSSFAANQIVKKLLRSNKGAAKKIAILGLTYKENSNDVRNSKVVDVYNELKEYGFEPLIYDPVANPHEIYKEYGIEMNSLEQIRDVHLIAVMVPHKAIIKLSIGQLNQMYDATATEKLLFDINHCFAKNKLAEAGIISWGL